MSRDHTINILCITTDKQHKTKTMKHLPGIFLSLVSTIGHADSLTIGSDLIQSLALGGWNVNATYVFDNQLIIGWSHGADLEIVTGDRFATSAIDAQNTNTNTSWSTGPEIGYRFAENWDTRLHFKLHQVEIGFNDNGENIDYQVFTIGPSLSYHWHPLKHRYERFVIEFSTRYWFHISDDLNNGTFTYLDANNQPQQHDPEEFWDGALSGFGANITFGYTF